MLAIRFEPTALGSTPGSITITTNAGNSPQTVTLSGTGSAQTTLSATSLSFGNEAVGSTSAIQYVRLTNNQTTALSITSLVASSGYALDPTTSCSTSSTVGSNAYCMLAIRFEPTSLGSTPGSITISTNAGNSPQTVTLSGTGSAQTTLSATSLSFGNEAVGSNSAIQYVRLTNNQTTALTITSLVASSGYALDPTTSCSTSSTVGSNAYCMLAIRFEPTALGATPGSITISTNAGNSPQTVTLSGTGIAQTTLSTTLLSFGNEAVGSTSAIQYVTLTNNQTTPLTVSSLTVTTGAPYVIGASSTCLNPTVAAGASCTVALTFNPVTAGAAPAASLTISTNAGNSPQTVTLSGTGGAQTTLSATSLNFGNEAVGSTSAMQWVKLTNNQTTALSITSLVASSGYALDPTTSCSTSSTVGSNAYCVLAIRFEPTALGSTPGSITISTNAGNSPQTVTLSGTGIAQTTLSPTSLSFGNEAVNSTSAIQYVRLTNNQTTALSITSLVASSGYALDPTTSCSTSSTVGSNAYCMLAIRFEPTSLGSQPGSITITTNAGNSPQTVTLSGTGVTTGSVTLNPTGLVFNSVEITNTVTKNVTLTNNQSVPLNIASITGFPAGFSLNFAATTCVAGTPVAASGGTCTIAVSVTPTTAGPLNGTITVNDDANPATQTFTVGATGTAKLVPSPLSLSFTSQMIGTTSTPPLTITLTNPQSVSEQISGVTITGPNAGDFSLSSTTCSTSVPLPAGQSCAISVTFTPSGPGTRTATLNVGDPLMIPLSGAGAAPVTVLPGLLTYTAPVGTTSTYQTVTITNASTTNAIHITNLSLSGDFTQTSSTCPMNPASLAAGLSCTLTISFNPSIGGVRDGQLQVYENDVATSPQVINLTGTGTYPLTLSGQPQPLSFSAQLVSTPSAPKTLTLTNNETKPETFTLSTTGDFTASSNCATGVIAAKSSCLVYIVFDPSSVTPTTRNGTLTVPNTAPGGPTPTWSLTGSAVATNPPAAVSVVSPGAGSAGTTINAVITGNGWTHFNASSVITFTQTDNSGTPCGITATVPDTTTTTLNTINAQLAISGVNPVYGACDISVATTLPAGAGTETALLEMAFIIADPDNAHTITGVSPNFGTQGQTMNVTLTATGTNFVDGVTYANFGDGITVNSLTVSDLTDAVANITISNTTYVGYRTITLVTGGEFAVSGSQAFQIGPNNATLTGLTLATVQGSGYVCTSNPVVVPQGYSGALCLTATGTHFLQNATLASFTGGILSPEVTVTSPTTAIVNVAVQGNATVGLQNLTISTGGEIATLNNAAAVSAATPALVGVAPGSGMQGQTLNVVITGNAFTTFPVGGPYTHPATDPIVADFTGEITVNSITVTSASSATVNITVSPNANVGGITASLSVSNGTGGATIFQFGFAVTAANESITSVTPACIPQGGQLTLNVTGLNTLWVQGTTTAAFYPVPYENITVPEVTINSSTSASLAVAVSTSTPPGTYGFYMATGGQIVSSTVNVCAATPSLTMSPSNGLLPTGAAVNNIPVSFTGQFTHFGPSTAAVISGEGVSLQNFTVTGLNSAVATVQIIAGTNGTPTATGTRLVTITTGGEIVTTNFNVTSTPVGIISVSPYHAPPSTTTSVEIVGLNTHFNQNTTQVLFGPQITVNNASLSVIDATHLTVSVTTSFIDNGTQPTPPGWQNIYVNSATGTGYVTAAGLPTTTGGVGAGAVVSITASNGNLTSCTATTAGSGYNVGDYVYPTQAGATGSACQVTAVNGTAIATLAAGTEQVMGGFLIDSPAQPTLVSVCVTGSDPCNSSAQQGATVDVTITGLLTNWVQGTTEAILGAGVTVSNLTITSPTTATATIAVSPTAPVGGNSVIMFTGSQIVSGTGFSVTPGAASIYSVGPNASCDANAVTFANFCGVSNGAGTPYVVSQLQTVVLNVVGVGTHWLQGETTFSFGSGVVVDNLTVSSLTAAQVEITVLSSSPVGFASLTATTGGEVATLQQAIDIEEGFPALLATSPGGQVQGDTLSMQVLGRYTNWQQGVTSAAFSPAGDITVNSVTVIDSDNLILNITISPLAYVDPCNPSGHVLTVTTGTVQVAGNTPPSGVSPSYFCVLQGAEQITSVSPNTFAQGTSGTVNITGSATYFEPGVTLVSFGDPNITTGTVSVSSHTGLSVPIAVSTSATVGYHTVTVTTLGEVASQVYGFTVSPNVATLNEAIPNQAEQGAPIITSPTCSTLPYCMIRLIGQYSHFSAESTATFGAGITVDSVSYVSPTEVDAYINIDPLSYTGSRLVTVTTPGVSCSYQPTFAVTNVTYQGCTPGVPTGTGSEIVSNTIFSIIPGPAIISQVAPATGNEGQEVVFNITGNATHWAQNFTQFYIAGGGYDITVNSVVINSATSATVDLSISPTANPGTRSIYMVTNGEALTDSGAFVVTGGVPVITYLSPNGTQNNPSTGTNGLEVDIYGLYTQWATGSTTINFGPGITVASFQVDDATHIEALINIDPSAQLGYRTVQAITTGLPAGTQILTSNFLVSAPAPPPTPYIWYVSPGSGIPGQTFTMTFYGAYTNWNPGTGGACSQSGTTITGFNASITVNCFQVLSPTTATANITISPSATASTSDLTLNTNLVGGGTEVDSAQFSVIVVNNTPTLTVVDPGSGMQGSQNLVVNILGKYTTFDNTTTFSFGSGVTANGPPTIIAPNVATQSISIDQLATLGGRSVVASTPDASGPDQVVSGGYFTVTPSLALILSVSPNIAKQGDTPQVEVTGQNTHWDGSTVFTFGAGIQVTKTQVNSLTDATVWLSIPALAPEGPTYVTATTLGEVANLNNGFVVQAGTPLLLSSKPGSEPQQGAAVFTILSQATQWTASTPTVSFGTGVVVTNVNVTSDTSLTVDGYITPTTPVGYRNLSVTSGTQVLGLNNALYITPGPAVINNVVTNTAGQGQEVVVTINGTNTNWLEGTTTLTFPNVLINSWSVTSPTTITADITVNDSAPAGEESVTATTLGEVATGVNVFTVTQTQPELLSVVASSQVQGWTGTVTLTGRFTHFNTAAGCSPNCTTVSFGTGSGITVNSVTAASTTSVQANITVQPTTTLGYRNVTVSTGSEVITLSNAFNVTIGPAAIQGPLSPASGAQNSSLTVLVTGSQTHFCTQPNANCQGTTVASFGGGIQVTGVTVIDLLHANVNITIPASTALNFYNVTLTTNGEVATILGGFTVTAGVPILTVVNPPTGHQGDPPFNVALTGLFTHFSCTGVCTQATGSWPNFGPGITINSMSVSDATDAVANITISPTATIGSTNVSVTTGAETASITGGFSILAGVPALLNDSPASGFAGNNYNVVVNGQFTNFTTTMPVSFGSGITVNYPLTSVTATQFTANITVASNASVGNRDLTVTNSGNPITLSNAFDVTAGTPVITQINPNIGNPAQTGLTVTITGQYTNWTSTGATPSTVTIGTPADGITVVGAAGPGLPGPVVSATATSITVNVNIASGAPLGPAEVWVTTGGSTQLVPGGFTVQAVTIPAPSIISFSPGLNACSPNCNYGPNGTVPINSDLTVVFSQPMNRNTFIASPAANPTVLLYLESNPGGQVAVGITLSVDATGRVMTITPSSPLAVNSQYYIELISNGPNVIKDATGNNFSNYGQYFYTEYTANMTPPTVIATSIPNGATRVGTNAVIQLEFSTDMNQSLQSDMTVTGPGGAVAGSYIWNSYPPTSNYTWGPGTILTFIPAAALTPSSSYTVSWGSSPAPLTDTAGNVITPGSFSFTTGSGTDTASNNPSSDIVNNQTNVGTNVAPVMYYSKPVNALDINTSTLLMYNSDSGKYIFGTVTVAPNGLSATFTPTYPLLPNTYYRFYQAAGYYDMDGNSISNTGAYLNGLNTYFTTGSGSDMVAPSVASVSPANGAAAVPLNAQIVVRFSAPVNPSTIVNGNAIQLSPSVAGTTTLASDLVTLTFVPASALAPSTLYNLSINGVADLIGNVVSFAGSTFQTATSIAPINVSTGFNASGQLITAGNTADANWVYDPFAGTPSQNTFGPLGGPAQPLLTVFSGETGWYSGWVANGPNSDWITINPNSTTGNTYGLYYTTFNISGSVPSNLCLVGAMGVDDNGLLAINGHAIMGNISAIYGLYSLNIPISSYLMTGTNTLSLGWGSTDNSYEAFRLQATIQTCGASLTGGLSLSSATPSNGASGVATNTTITLNFSNPIDPATVNSTTLPIMVGWNSNQEIAGNYAVNGNQVIFTPDSPLPINTLIWIGACNGPYDLAGEYISGCYTQLSSFTTGGTAIAPSAPFQVAVFTPFAGATNVGLRAPVTATFNRSFNPSTINASDFGLFNGDSQSPWCTSYSRSQDNSTLSFNCYALPSSATLTAMLNSGLQDWSGNGLVNFTSQFTTMPSDSNTNGSVITSPSGTATSTRPGNGASGISVNQPITIFTNLPINPATASSGFEVAENNVAVTGTVQVLDNGYTLEFTPNVPWSPGALVQWWTTTSLMDTTYNTSINQTSGYFYVASSTGTLTPTVQSISPVDGASNIALNTFFDVQFNTPLNPVTVCGAATCPTSAMTGANIYLSNGYGGLQLAGVYSMPLPNVVRIVPSSPLPASSTIYLRVTTGLQSITSVPATANYWYASTGTATDATLPVVTNAVPMNGSTGIGVNDTPGVTFSKPIDPVSVNSNTFKVTNGGMPLAGGYWFNSTNTRVNFVPNAPLPANTNLVMTVNGVLDLVDNPITFSSSFTTGAGPDFTAPTVVWTSVSSNESIPTNSAITIQFSESMDATTFSTSNIYITDQLLGSHIAATLTWNATQSVAYLAPSAPLASGREYYLSVSGGTDLAGNQVGGYGIYFYAGLNSASAAPTVINFNPMNGATGLGTNVIIEAQFSAPIDPTTVSGVTLTGGGTVQTTPVMSAANTVLQLVPSAPLAPNTTYTMTVSGVKDPAGNTVATVTNSFTTGPTYDTTAPTVVTTDPISCNASYPDNCPAYGTNVTPKIVFNKPLNPITVNNSSIVLYLNDTGQFIPATVTLSANGLEVTITPQLQLLTNTEYRFYVSYNSYVQDQDGNNITAGWYYFYTGTGANTTSPTVAVSPLNGATNIPINTQVVAMVSAPVDPTSWNQNSIQVLNGATPVPGTVSLPNSQMLMFTPAGVPAPQGTYLGCYNDTGSRVLNGYYYSSGSMTVESCVATCNAQGYAYAGAQDGSQCFCGNGPYNSAGQGNACSYTCSGNSGEICGGSYANSVYTANSSGTASLFASGTTFTVNVSGFTDANGNTVVPSNTTFTTGSTSADGGLTVTSTNIGNGATGVSATSPIIFTFNHVLNPATVTSSTLDVFDGWSGFHPLAGTLSVNGNQITFTPANPYPSGANIAVGNCNGPSDVLGNVLGGGCWNELLSFTVVGGTPTTTPFTVLSVSPANGAANVGRDQSVSVTFSNSINPGSTTGYNTQLYAGQDLQTNGSVTLSADGRTVTFNVGALTNGATYTIMLPAGGIADDWGNTLSTPFTSTFSTIADPATGNGSVQSAVPGNTTGIPTDTLLTLYMNRQVNPSTVSSSLTVTVNGQVYSGNTVAVGGGYEIQYTPTTPFPYGAAVQWFFSGAMDVYGDTFNSNSGYFYTVAAPGNPSTTAPAIVAISPRCCGSTIATNAEIDVEYSLPINPATVNTTNVYKNAGPAGLTFSVGLAPGTNNVVRISPPAGGWNPNYNYIGFCSNGNVQGTNGVNAASSCWLTYFYTAAGPDTTSGTVTIGPPNGVVNVGTNAFIRLQFSKPVDVTTINSTNVAITASGNPIPGTWSYNYSGNDIVGANFYPVNPLPPSTPISVSVSGLLDYAGNTFTSATSTFTTATGPDFNTPTVSFDFPGGTTGIATNASFNCRYSEPIDPSSVTSSGLYIYSYGTSAHVPLNPYTFSSDLMTVTMTPTTALPANTQYYMACYNAIDLTGNGQSNSNVGFYTGSGPSSAGPTLLYANPPNNMTNVPVNTNNGPWAGSSLGLLFNEPVAGYSLGNITLTPNGGSPIPIAAYTEYGNTIVWVQLPWALAPSTQYTYNITGVTDYNGNAITPVTSTFTTGTGFDFTQPTVASTVPANGATGVADNIAQLSLTFSEAMDPILIGNYNVYLQTHNTHTNVPVTLSFSADFTTVYLTPSAPLAAGTIYDLVIYGNNWWPYDIAGNSFSTSGYVTTNNGYVYSTFTTQ
jgi:hypothetical protein